MGKVAEKLKATLLVCARGPPHAALHPVLAHAAREHSARPVSAVAAPNWQALCRQKVPQLKHTNTVPWLLLTRESGRADCEACLVGVEGHVECAGLPALWETSGIDGGAALPKGDGQAHKRGSAEEAGTAGS